MNKPYNIKSHPTYYKGIRFRSRLEARWAAFFDVIGWKWEYEPLDICGWTPDFQVSFPCGHSDCPPTHSLLVEIKPYLTIDEFEGHPCTLYAYGQNEEQRIPADASAAFGNNPHVTEWEMSHGAGGGIENLSRWCDCNIDEVWITAGNIVQYTHRRRSK